MPRLRCLLCCLLLAPAVVSAEALPRPIAEGLASPFAACVGHGGNVHVTVSGAGKGQGAVVVLKDGKAVPVVEKLTEPRGIVFWNDRLIVADADRLIAIDGKGKVETLAGPESFPGKPRSLTALAVDADGTFYVTDSGDPRQDDGAMYRIPREGRIVLVADTSRSPGVKTCGGMIADTPGHLLTLDTRAGELHRQHGGGPGSVRIESNLLQPAGITFDHHGRLFVGTRRQGKGTVVVIPRLGDKPVVLATGFESVSALCLDATGKNVLVVDRKAGTITALRANVPGAEVDDSPLAVTLEPAFPGLTWEGVKEGATLRPVVLTHANDGSGRTFVGMQDGTVHVIGKDAKKTKVFLDLTDRVDASAGRDGGLLGMALTLKKVNRHFVMVYYPLKGQANTNVLCRIPIDPKTPDRADRTREQVLLKVPRDKGTCQGGGLAFGPDGYLYASLGSGGGYSSHAESWTSLLGGIVRADVVTYTELHIPNDNPWHGHALSMKELWAYGLRNARQLAFDRKTGTLWTADEGVHYQEVNIITRGGLLGWPRSEGIHPGRSSDGRPTSGPVWEYDRALGTSIVGGFVYRGKAVPELEGSYLYGDHVSGRLWALRQDDRGRVVANRPLGECKGLVAFGEDEAGEVYLLTAASDGKAIRRFVRPAKP